MAAHLLLDLPYLPIVSEEVKDLEDTQAMGEEANAPAKRGPKHQKYPKDKDRFMIERAVNTTAATNRCM